MSTNPVAELMASMPELFPTTLRVKTGQPVRITYEGMEAFGTVTSQVAGSENVQVELDGTGQQVWVPRDYLSRIDG